MEQLALFKPRFFHWNKLQGLDFQPFANMIGWDPVLVSVDSFILRPVDTNYNK